MLTLTQALTQALTLTLSLAPTLTLTLAPTLSLSLRQVKHITAAGWEARFQCLTVVIVSLPLMLGSVVTLVAWGG